MYLTPSMRHLLWKDFHQVRPALVGCAVSLMCVQLLYLGAQLLAQGTSMSIFPNAYAVALVAPTLAAIACSGLLIGQERQTRTWNWSSSLPISWASALTSKMIVWLLGSVGLTLLLLLSYFILYKLALLAGRTPGHQPLLQGAELRFLFAMLLLIPFEVFVVFSIAALFWNDTLLALVIAGVAVAIGHLILVDPAGRTIHGIPWNQPYNPEDHLATAALLLVTAIALAAVGLCGGFRWRWTTGQFVSLSLKDLLRSRVWARPRDACRPDASGSDVAARRAVPIVWPTTMAKPNETAMMFRHAWRSGLAVRAAVLILMLVNMLLAPSGAPVYPLAILIGPLLLGATAFGSEHALGRYRFFADRGGSWFRFLIAHVGVAFAWLIVLLAISFWLADARSGAANFDRPSAFVLAVSTFGIAVFSSLCVSNPIIATTLSGFIVFACAICFETAHRLWASLTGQGGLVYAALPLTGAVVLAALVYQTRRWFILERPRSGRVLTGAWLIGLFLPIGLYLTLGFLTIPKYPWAGEPADQLHSSGLPRLPRFTAELPENSTMLVTPFRTDSLAAWEQRLGDSYRTRLLHLQEYSGGVPAWLQVWQEPLKELNAELADTETFATPNQPSLSTYLQLIEKSATLGVAATQAGDAPNAVAAWKFNHALLKLSEDNIDLATYSLPARMTTWGMWNLLSRDELAFLQAEIDLRDLLPGRVDDSLWTRKLRARWDVRKRALRSPAAQNESSASRYDAGPPVETDVRVPRTLMYYPPLRWAVERIMAQRLSQELEVLAGHQPAAAMVSIYSVAQNDPLAYQVQMLHQLEQQVTAKVAAAR